MQRKGTVMKFRTDFVTNSSSSSFCVSVTLKYVNGDREDLEFSPFALEDFECSYSLNFTCSAEDVLGAESVEALTDLLSNTFEDSEEDIDKDTYEDSRASICRRFGVESCEELDEGIADAFVEVEDGVYKDERRRNELDTFLWRIRRHGSDITQISTISFKRKFEAYGEEASCLVWNDDALSDLADAVCTASASEKEAAIEAMKEYLETEEVYTDSDTHCWPSGFMGNRHGGKYAWDGSIEELAELIVAEEISPDDDAIETTVIDMQNRTISHEAIYSLREK
jgi:hypothetical protein